MDEPRVSNRQVEGSRLALLRQRQTGLSTGELFTLYFKIFLSFNEIKEINTPFIERQVGPAWFKQDFPATNPDDEENINEIWLAFLSPTVLSSRLGAGKQYLGLVGYQPNLVARQFGFSQFLPKSLFKNSNLIVLGNSGIHEEYFDSYLKDVEKIKYDINPFAYSNSLLCTLEFTDWWSDYYKNKAIDEKVVLQRLNTGIDALGLKVPKSKVVSTTSTATTKQAKPKNSSTSTASGVSTRVRKIPASKDIPEVTETRSKRETSPVKDTGKSKKTKANQLISTSGDTLIESNTSSMLIGQRKGQIKSQKIDKSKSKLTSDEGGKTKEDTLQTTTPSVENIQTPLNMPSTTEVNEENSPPKDNTTEVGLPGSIQRQTMVENIQEEIQQQSPLQDLADPLNNDQVMDDDQDDQSLNAGESSSEEINGQNSPHVEESQSQSTSSTSEQSSSTEEMSVDDEVIKEAKEGGSDILPIASTSKLSASAGISENEYVAMEKADPSTALSLLLTKKRAQSSSSEKILNTPTHSDFEIHSSFRQGSLEQKLYSEYLNKDILESISENPAVALSHKNFLTKLRNPNTDSQTLGIVFQLDSVIDQFAKAVQKKKDNTLKLDAQEQAKTVVLEKAITANESVERLKAEVLQTQQAHPDVVNCDQNINAWEEKIKVLKLQIQEYEENVAAEKLKRTKLQDEIAASTKDVIEEKARQGIKLYSASEAIDEEIRALAAENQVLDVELTFIRSLYENLQAKHAK
ncbi:hypothetical protein TSUD_137440 [Trifolium subterraneum]|uniref:Aminotransferase-like plant mobile domain-containing protein n=1 Tax=Trifolium subterraneum TaxID=3900 RepID=A0A2Z6NYL8_TRISU|nr:hypothetical protein TSUD_137440 [Trifolium subterraneum]